MAQTTRKTTPNLQQAVVSEKVKPVQPPILSPPKKIEKQELVVTQSETPGLWQTPEPGSQVEGYINPPLPPTEFAVPQPLSTQLFPPPQPTSLDQQHLDKESKKPETPHFSVIDIMNKPQLKRKRNSPLPEEKRAKRLTLQANELMKDVSDEHLKKRLMQVSNMLNQTLKKSNRQTQGKPCV